MPIHLPPISRRNFLKRSLLAGAGLALAPELLAASRRTDRDSWVFFSDTHISADAAKIARGINMTDHLKQATREVLSLPARPAGVFVTGDCAFNSGEMADYAQFTSLMQPLRADGMPLHLTLGNHDNREHFWSALKETKSAKRVDDHQVAMIKGHNVNWFILDSLEKTLQTPGRLGEEQLNWLAKSLDANKSKPAIVQLHHNPGASENVNGLKDTDALFDVIRPRRHVKAWIFGHTHSWNVSTDESELHLVNLPPVAYVFKRQAVAGWVHATVSKDGMKLELRSLDTTHQDHGKIVELKWRA